MEAKWVILYRSLSKGTEEPGEWIVAKEGVHVEDLHGQYDLLMNPEYDCDIASFLILKGKAPIPIMSNRVIGMSNRSEVGEIAMQSATMRKVLNDFNNQSPF